MVFEIFTLLGLVQMGGISLRGGAKWKGLSEIQAFLNPWNIPLRKMITAEVEKEDKEPRLSLEDKI